MFFSYSVQAHPLIHRDTMKMCPWDRIVKSSGCSLCLLPSYLLLATVDVKAEVDKSNILRQNTDTSSKQTVPNTNPL